MNWLKIGVSSRLWGSQQDGACHSAMDHDTTENDSFIAIEYESVDWEVHFPCREHALWWLRHYWHLLTHFRSDTVTPVPSKSQISGTRRLCCVWQCLIHIVALCLCTWCTLCQSNMAVGNPLEIYRFWCDHHLYKYKWWIFHCYAWLPEGKRFWKVTENWTFSIALAKWAPVDQLNISWHGL